MSKGRLTRQELGWLLTQEAQGAAERLRRGVQILKSNAPPADPGDPIIKIPPPAPVGVPDSEIQIQMKPISSFPAPGGIDATLDALDDAMKMLSSLHQKTATTRGRRGRIDLAALIWEVAPEARVSIEPGSGTEVFGDEAEFRRMLQILCGHGTGAGSQITIRRQGDDVRASIALGPEGAGSSEVERAWVSRMAVRFGGRFELEGGTEVLTLPADGVSEKKEREALRKELDEARKQGEAYARDLAAMMTQEMDSGKKPSTIPPEPILPGAERFFAASKLAGGIAAELRSILSPASRQLPARGAEAHGDHEERWEMMRRTLSRTQEMVSLLSLVGEVDTSEVVSEIDLAETARSVVKMLAQRADRDGVEIRTELSERIHVFAAPHAASVMLQALLVHALDASPRGTNVSLAVQKIDDQIHVWISDSGASIPSGSRTAYVQLALEPGTYGRPSSVPLFFASEIARWQGAALSIEDAPEGGAKVSVAFGRSRI